MPTLQSKTNRQVAHLIARNIFEFRVLNIKIQECRIDDSQEIIPLLRAILKAVIAENRALPPLRQEEESNDRYSAYAAWLLETYDEGCWGE